MSNQDITVGWPVYDVGFLVKQIILAPTAGQKDKTER